MIKDESIRLSPYLRDIIWGGTKLRKSWNKVSDMERIAESWELSAYAGMESVVVDGEFKGKTLKELFANNRELFGTKLKDAKEFPILIKLIDASNNLSIQVHPDDDYAWKVEGEPGKTEMWYIAEADTGACIYFGFNKDVTKQEVKAAVKDGSICDLLNKVPVKSGDSFFVKAGTPHAILSGITIIEIQESSNSTYRMYDYGRLGADGKPRQLHIDKALDVLNYQKTDGTQKFEGKPEFISGDVNAQKLAECDYFTVYCVEFEGMAKITAPESGFVTFTIAEGGSGKYLKGETAFLPAGKETTLTGFGKAIVTII